MLENLNNSTTPSKRSKKRRGWIAGIAAVAAAACIVVMALPRTVGAESIFDVLFRWTSSVFEFFSPEEDATNPPVEYIFETDNSGLQQLYDKVTEFGATEPVVPMWMPEGLELQSLKEYVLRDNGYKVNAAFNGNGKVVAISYRISSDVTTKFEKEETAVELFEYADTSHFVLENDENLSVTWTIEGVECVMNTNIAKEDVYAIIISIYRRPLE